MKEFWRHSRLFLALSLVFLGVAIFAWLATFTDSYEGCRTVDHPRAGETKSAKSDQWIFLHCEGNAIDANSGTITAVATIFLALITYMLVGLGRVQSNTTRAELRAYVFPQVAKLEKFSLTEPIAVTVVWKNAGHTPAKVFQTHGGVFVGSFPLKNDAHFEDESPTEPQPTGRHSKSALFPGGEVSIVYSAEKVLSHPDVQKEVVEKRAAIYVVGRAFYQDVFGDDHTSVICNFIDPDDAVELIEAERKNLALSNFKVRFTTAHVMNDFT